MMLGIGLVVWPKVATLTVQHSRTRFIVFNLARRSFPARRKKFALGYSNGKVRPRPYSLVILTALAMGLMGCRNVPPPSPPPEQRPPVMNPVHWQRIVQMNDVDAQDHFLRDIDSQLGGTWRWSAKRPAIRLKPLTVEHLKYSVELAVPEQTFRTTGPVKIRFLVNGKQLDQVLYSTPGTHKFEKEVPQEWLHAGYDVILSAEIDKIYMDGDIPRGFIIVSMGLVNSSVPLEQE
jgi:hypothetical protein